MTFLCPEYAPELAVRWRDLYVVFAAEPAVPVCHALLPGTTAGSIGENHGAE